MQITMNSITSVLSAGARGKAPASAAAPAKRLFSDAELRRLLVPLTLEQILFTLVGAADTFMAASLGEEAVAGVTLINILEFFVISLLASLAAGGGTLVSQYLGARQPKQAELAAGQTVLLSLLPALLLTASVLIWRQELLELLYGSAAPAVRQAAGSYLAIAVLSVPSIALHQSCSAAFRAVNAARFTLYAVLAINLVNLGGNYLAVYVLQARTGGLAWATVAARLTGNILLLACALRCSRQTPLRAGAVFSWHWPMLRRILQVAVPGSIENGLFAAGKVMMTAIVARFGTVQIAANAVANTFQIAAVFFINAMNLALVPVVGRCVGAGDYAQARFYTDRLLRLSYIVTAALAALSCAALYALLPLYNISRETAELTLLLTALHNLAAALLQPTCFNLPNALRAAGDVRFTMCAGIASMLLCRLGLALVLGIWLDWQIFGVWAAMAADWLARSLLFRRRYKSGRWQSCRLV